MRGVCGGGRSVQSEIFRFLIVGCLSTLLNYVVFLLSYWLGFFYLTASAIGFISGVVLGYFLNKNWTYAVKRASTPGLVIRYLLVYSFSLLAGLAFINILVGELGLSPLAGNILSICLTTFLNLIGTRFFVFK